MVASLLLRLIARITAFNIRNWSLRPVQTQEKQFKHLIDSAKKTSFGSDHNFQKISSYKDFVKNVPVREYEGIKAIYRKGKKWRKQYIVARKTNLFCTHLRDHIRIKVHPNN